MTITTVKVKSLGKTQISIIPDQVISETGGNRNVVELDNETILFAAEQIKEKAGAKEKNLSSEYDADSILYYAISHAMAGVGAADKRHCEFAVTNVKKAIRDNKPRFFPLLKP